MRSQNSGKAADELARSSFAAFALTLALLRDLLVKFSFLLLKSLATRDVPLGSQISFSPIAGEMRLDLLTQNIAPRKNITLDVNIVHPEQSPDQCCLPQPLQLFGGTT